jgi:TIR domain
MRIFVSYASEQRELAQRIALALTGSGFDVFFDREQLAPAGEFNLAIRNAIHASDLFLFVASREALEAGAYTLTELGIAERRWPHPAERVMTLRADTTPLGALPPYLSAVTVLDPAGDRVAETVDAVVRWRDRRRRLWLTWAAGVLTTLAIVAAGAVWQPWTPEPEIGSDGEPTDADLDGGVANARVYQLKNGRRVRLAGQLARNDSNVGALIVRRYVERDAWRYNRCYDAYFGQLSGEMPEGAVEIGFDIIDQLPRHASVVHSDFPLVDFSDCVRATVAGQTLNAAGPSGAGKVRYRFRFLPD